jgi:hypothetical protein
VNAAPKSRRFGKRTWRYLAAVWIGAAVLELAVLELARRTNNSWVLLLGVAILAVPLVATERTLVWLRRAPRTRWKRHDLEDLQQMYRAGTASPSTAVSLSAGTCYLCTRQLSAGEGRTWKLLGSVQGTRILCQSCDNRVRTAAEADGE